MIFAGQLNNPQLKLEAKYIFLYGKTTKYSGRIESG